MFSPNELVFVHTVRGPLSVVHDGWTLNLINFGVKLWGPGFSFGTTWDHSIPDKIPWSFHCDRKISEQNYLIEILGKKNELKSFMLTWLKHIMCMFP